MKMVSELFEELKADCLAIMRHYEVNPESPIRGADAWFIFRQVWSQRSYDNSHPTFASGATPRILEATHVFQEKGYNYLDRFYNAGLNDAHIQTALQKIMPNAVFKDAKRY